ncbi:MAG: hypothetical protein NTW38_08035 [Candidatus Aminicenantes bacterium]|nr:hypothetical protein [Candidatus Aminicenantes bacterium]
MKFFLDTANLKEIREIAGWEIPPTDLAVEKFLKDWGNVKK